MEANHESQYAFKSKTHYAHTWFTYESNDEVTITAVKMKLMFFWSSNAAGPSY